MAQVGGGQLGNENHMEGRGSAGKRVIRPRVGRAGGVAHDNSRSAVNEERTKRMAGAGLSGGSGDRDDRSFCPRQDQIRQRGDTAPARPGSQYLGVVLGGPLIDHQHCGFRTPPDVQDHAGFGEERGGGQSVIVRMDPDDAMDGIPQEHWSRTHSAYAGMGRACMARTISARSARGR